MKGKNKRVALFRLFWIFFKAGTFTFAGGLAMLPLIQKDIIDKYGMLDEETFLDYAALSQTLPGIIALNCAVFCGRKVAGVAGAFAAGFGTIFPAFTAMLAATILLNSLPETELISHIFDGVRSASGALIFYSAMKLMNKNYRKIFPITLMGLSFVLVFFLKISAFWVIICAALAGLAMKMARDRKPPDKAGNAGGGSRGDGGGT